MNLHAIDQQQQQQQQQPLLPSNGSRRRRRFRRCKSAPSVEIDDHRPDPLPSATANADGDERRRRRPRFRQVALFLAVYLAVGVAGFYLVGGEISGSKTNEVVDALYLSVVTMTTVGYGDLFPTSDAAKLLACVLVFSGMAVVALSVSEAADHLVEKQEVMLVKALHHLRDDPATTVNSLTPVDGEVSMGKKLATTAASLLLLVVAGTAFLVGVEGLNLVDALYCVCCTITTLGYGDKSFATEGGRAFAAVWILASTVCLAQFFFYLAGINAERGQRRLAAWALARRNTAADLEAADLDDDGSVSAAEFVVYKLKEMGKISEEDVALVMQRFQELDFDNSGDLSRFDISQQQSPPPTLPPSQSHSFQHR